MCALGHWCKGLARCRWCTSSIPDTRPVTLIISLGIKDEFFNLMYDTQIQSLHAKTHIVQGFTVDSILEVSRKID